MDYEGPAISHAEFHILRFAATLKLRHTDTIFFEDTFSRRRCFHAEIILRRQ
jgi:hypothetical protein